MRHVVLLNVFLLIVLTAGSVFAAQEPAAPAGPNPDDEQQAQRMMDEVRALVLPQQKDRAREMIKRFPDTRLAKLAQKLLDEYDRFDKLAAADAAREQAYKSCIREYWKCRYPSWEPAMPEPMRITNTTGEPFLYQVRGPEMEWSRIYTLRPNQSHVFRYPLVLRRFTKDNVIEQHLCVGVQYRFVAPATGGDPMLTW